MNLLAHDATLRRALEFRVRARRDNSQPWRWRANTTDGIDLFADRTRHLITIDVDGRDLARAAAKRCTT